MRFSDQATLRSVRIPELFDLSFRSEHYNVMTDIHWHRTVALVAGVLTVVSYLSGAAEGGIGMGPRSGAHRQNASVPYVAGVPQARRTASPSSQYKSPSRQPSYERTYERPATTVDLPTYIPPIATPALPVTPATPVNTSELESLAEKIRRVRELYVSKRLNSRDHDCWEIMHAVIGYGVDTEIQREAPGGSLVNGAGWLCFNGSCQNYRMLYVENGRIMARQGVGVQGHYGQFLAILAQSYMPLTYPMQVDGRDFTVNDLLESEKYTCQTGMELTFKLIAVSHYSQDLNETWRNQFGQEWSVEKLVKEEIAAPIRGAACGGTHRLMGLAYAVRKRELLNQPIDGEFARAKKYLEDYHRYTLALQNRDGSFSTEWFRGPGSRPDLGRRLQTTGHILEWLVFSLPKEELTSPKVVQAVNYLATIMLSNMDRTWEIGPLGHAIHALGIYDERQFRASQANRETLATRAKGKSDAVDTVTPTGAKVDVSTSETLDD